ncbi:alpha/beta hydrolase [Microbacterium sp. NPDC076911]|uniref:alpha/beta fold hydrolase n=1 Tax=Microbacterium sp. NPDC076911 TaxID=3154958 RepID=UPI003428BFEA
MPAPVVLPRLSWGSARSPRRALMIHGLGSNGALMWRFGTALAEAGWYAQAVDLRGHGTAPRVLDYSIAAYAADLAETCPARGGSWDLVIGHSLGGSTATVVAASDPSWTKQLVLIDPAIHLLPHDRQTVRNSQEQSFADPTREAVRAEHPHWHEHDVELKAQSAQQVSRWAVEQTSEQNSPWDVRDAAARLTTPTHVIGADPKVYSIFTGELAAEVLAANPRITMSIVPGSGHSPHRDKPEATIAALHLALRER